MRQYTYYGKLVCDGEENNGGKEDERISSWASWRERPLATQAMIICNELVEVHSEEQEEMYVFGGHEGKFLLNAASDDFGIYNKAGCDVIYK